MTGAEQILVIILATFLAIFLLLGIIALVLCIRILRAAQRITDHIEHIAGNAEAFTESLANAGGPLGFVMTVSRMAAKMFGNKHAKTRGR